MKYTKTLQVENHFSQLSCRSSPCGRGTISQQPSPHVLPFGFQHVEDGSQKQLIKFNLQFLCGVGLLGQSQTLVVAHILCPVVTYITQGYPEHRGDRTALFISTLSIGTSVTFEALIIQFTEYYLLGSIGNSTGVNSTLMEHMSGGVQIDNKQNKVKCSIICHMVVSHIEKNKQKRKIKIFWSWQEGRLA